MRNKRFIRVKPLPLEVQNTKHFVDKLFRRGIHDLSLIGQVIVELLRSKEGDEIEVTNGRATIVATMGKNQVAALVTCWPGMRKVHV